MTPLSRAKPLQLSRPRVPAAPLGRILFAIGLVLIVIVGWLAFPYVLWGYNLQRAISLQTTALAWPEPRLADSLPTLRDEAANEAALGHLAAAIRWRPTHGYAYRQAALSQIAQGEWALAADSLEQATSRAPHELLWQWEKALVYEQLRPGTDSTPLTAQFAAATPDAPNLPLETPFCQEGNIPSCYVGATVFTGTLAYATSVLETPETLFVHPPARVSTDVTLSNEQPALAFWMGLYPDAKDWATDGATFQVWLTEAGGGIYPLFERTFTKEELVEGWNYGWVDLSPWAGQAVALTVGTAPGPAGDNAADWVGFGNLRLTTVPNAKAGQALVAAQVPPFYLNERGEEALYAARYDEAKRWFSRVTFLPLNATSALAYTDYSQAFAAGDEATAQTLLEAATTADTGWPSVPIRFHSFYVQGRNLVNARQFAEAEAVFIRAVESPLRHSTDMATLAEIYRLLAWSQSQQEKIDEAHYNAYMATILDPSNYEAQLSYGRLIYGLNPARGDEADAVFRQYLALSSDAPSYRNVILFWINAGESNRATAFCEIALASYSNSELDNLCWQGTAGSSTLLFNEYRKLLREDEEATAWQRLERAVSTDDGWQTTTERFLAWHDWSRYLYRNGRYEEAVVASDIALNSVAPTVDQRRLTEVYVTRADARMQLQRYDEALTDYAQAIALTPSEFNYYAYGVALYRQNPANLRDVQASFEQAIAAASDPIARRAQVLEFWFSEGQSERATQLCALPDLSETEARLCPTAGQAASGTLFNDYLTTPEAERATALLEEAVTLDDGWFRRATRYRAFFLWGRYLVNERRYDEALPALEEALTFVPDSTTDAEHSTLYYLYGLTLAQADRTAEAMAAYEEALDQDDENAAAWVAYGLALYASDPNAAEEAIATALTLAPTDVGIQGRLISFYTERGDLQRATALCQQATPDLQAALAVYCFVGETPSTVYYAEFRAKRTEDAAAAYAALEQAITVDGGWLQNEQRYAAWREWGQYLYRENRFAEAAPALTQALALITASRPDSERADLTTKLGLALYTIADYAAAAPVLNAAIALNPENVARTDLLAKLGTAHYATGDYTAAVATFEEAVALAPDNASLYLELGRALYRADPANSATAQAAFAQARTLAPDTVGIWASQVRFWLEQQQIEAARTICDSAPPTVRDGLQVGCWNQGDPSTLTYGEYRRLLPDNATTAYPLLGAAVTQDAGWASEAERFNAHNEWSGYLFNFGRLGEALPVLQKTIEMSNNRVAAPLLSKVYERLGVVLFLQGEQAAGWEALTEAIAIEPANASAYLQRAITYSISNDDRAQADFDKAVALTAETPDVWRYTFGFWRVLAPDQLLRLCAQVQATPLASSLADLCQ